MNNGRDALREQVRSMKGKMEYTSVEKIDEAIARMEGRLQHSSMPLAEEKRVLEDIKKLRASRVSAKAELPEHRPLWMSLSLPQVLSSSACVHAPICLCAALADPSRHAGIAVCGAASPIR